MAVLTELSAFVIHGPDGRERDALPQLPAPSSMSTVRIHISMIILEREERSHGRFVNTLSARLTLLALNVA